MTMYNTTPRTARASDGFAGDLGFAWTTIRRAVRWVLPTRPTGLEHLDDHMLRDIGLTRNDVGGLTSGALDMQDVEARRLRL